MLRSFRREVLRSLYWQQRTKFPSITLLPESEAVCTAVIFFDNFKLYACLTRYHYRFARILPRDSCLTFLTRSIADGAA